MASTMIVHLFLTNQLIIRDSQCFIIIPLHQRAPPGQGCSPVQHPWAWLGLGWQGSCFKLKLHPVPGLSSGSAAPVAWAFGRD